MYERMQFKHPHLQQQPCRQPASAAAQFGGVDLDPAATTLWFAGKELTPAKLLSEYVGRNEHTRIVVKLQKKGAGPPAREPVSVCCSSGRHRGRRRAQADAGCACMRACACRSWTRTRKRR